MVTTHTPIKHQYMMASTDGFHHHGPASHESSVCGLTETTATPLAINQGIAKYYAAGMRDESAAQEVVKSSGKKSKQPSKSKDVQPRNLMSQLNAEEKSQRRQIGIIIICFGISLPFMFDQFVLKPLLFPTTAWLPVTVLIVAPIAILWVVKVFWK